MRKRSCKTHSGNVSENQIFKKLLKHVDFSYAMFGDFILMVNIVTYSIMSSNVLATRKWHCPVLAI